MIRNLYNRYIYNKRHTSTHGYKNLFSSSPSSCSAFGINAFADGGRAWLRWDISVYITRERDKSDRGTIRRREEKKKASINPATLIIIIIIIGEENAVYATPTSELGNMKKAHPCR